MAKNITTPIPQQTSHKKYYLLLVLVVVVVFANTLFNGYNLDDNLVTINHPYTSKGLQAIGKIFTSSYYTNKADINFGYRPIVHLSFAIEHQFFGEKAAISHFFNLLIYIGCVLTFFKLLINWFGENGLWFAFATALLFSVHPIHCEAVASIKNRDELLAFLFAMLSFIQLNKFADKQQWWRVGLVITFFAIGLLAKKSIYPLVFLMPVVLVIVKQQQPRNVIFLTLCMSILVGVVAGDFILQRSLLLTTASIVWSVIFIGLTKAKLLVKQVQKEVSYFLIWILAMVFSILSGVYSDYSIFVIAIFCFLYLVQKQFYTDWLMLSVVLSMVFVGWAIHLTVLYQIAILLCVFLLVEDFKNKSFNVIHIITSVIALGIILFLKPNIGVLLLLLVHIVAFYFWQSRYWVTLVLYIVVPIFVLVFFRINYLYVLLPVLAIYMLLQQRFALLTKLKPIGFILILILPIVLLPQTKTQQISKRWQNINNSEYNVSIAQQTNQSNVNVDSSIEGRSLHYVENTLVGNQTLEAKFTTGIITIGQYLKTLLVPNELSFYYGYAKIQTSSFSDLNFWFSIILLLICVVCGVYFFKSNKLVGIGLLWFLGTILLFSNWVELVAGMVGERLAFTASAGFSLFIVALTAALIDKKLIKPKLAMYFIIVFASVLSLRSIARNSDWKSLPILVENDMEHLSESVYASHMYAQTCMAEATSNTELSNQVRMGLVNKAEQALVKANKTYPNYFNAQFDLARIYIFQQRFTEAKIYLEHAYAIDSNNVFVLEELAKTCFDLNLPEETIKYAEQYILFYPQNENIYEILAYTYYKQGAYRQAKTTVNNGLEYFAQSKNLNGLLVDIEKQIALEPNISKELLHK